MEKIETKIIGAFLLGGGAVGTYRAIVTLSHDIGGGRLLILLIMASIMVFTLYSGYQILNKEVQGLENGRAIMIIQFIQFAVMGLGVSFYTGGYLAVHLLRGRIGFSYDIDSAFIINFIDDPNYFLIRINLLAIAIFIYLTKLIKEQKAV